MQQLECERDTWEVERGLQVKLRVIRRRSFRIPSLQTELDTSFASLCVYRPFGMEGGDGGGWGGGGSIINTAVVVDTINTVVNRV